MKLGFAAAARRGQHFELVDFCLRKLKTVNLNIKGQTERHFEHTIVSYLQASHRLRVNLITQIGEDEVEKINSSTLFGFKHRPDVSIGNDGTAIEIKVITTSLSIRDILGQALAYRMHYRFVILVLIDQTPDSKVVELCRDKRSQESVFLTGLADSLNIFSVVGPVASSRNIIFKPTASLSASPAVSESVVPNVDIIQAGEIGGEA